MGFDKSKPELSFDKTVGSDGLLSYKIDWSQIEKKEGKRRVFYIKLYDKKKNLLYKPYIDKPSAAFYTDIQGKVSLLAGSNLKFDESTPGMALVAIEDGGDVGNTCEPLIWGKKFTCTERKKVIQIAENLGIGKDKIEGANWLMAVMALETGGEFDPGIKNRQGFVGLIQFGKAAAEGLGTTRDDLQKMTVLGQLNYVERYFGKYKSRLKTLTDVYLAVLYPAASGHGDKKDYVVFDDSGSGIEKKAYKQNPLFHYEEDEVERDDNGKIIERHGRTGGKTYIWEVKMAIQSWYSRGLPKKNKCKTDASTCEFGSNTGENTNAEGFITMIRKWENWTGDNETSTTISSFSVGNSDLTGYIVEPHGNATEISNQDKCIPLGTYSLVWHISDKFTKNKYVSKGQAILNNGFPKLFNDNVSKNRGILLHIGNIGKDTEGCLLPGAGLKKEGENVTGVTNSTTKFYELIEYIESKGIDNVKIIIKQEN